MGNNVKASGLVNIINYDTNGNISFVSGSTTLLYISSSGAVAATGSSVSGSSRFLGNVAITGSLTVSGSNNLISGSLITVGDITGSNARFTGTITTQTLVVQTITASQEYSSGSNVFGNALTNTQVMTGSLQVTGSNPSYFLGANVGIGVTNPTVALDVTGYGRVTGIGLNTTPISIGANPNYIRLTNTGNDFYIGTEGSSAGGFFSGTAAAYDNVFYAGKPFNFIISGVSRMYINGSGQVGIGTTTPNGNSRLTITDPTSVSLYWKATNANAATRDWCIITNNANFGDFAIRQGNSQGADATSGTDRLTILAGGNVGIGTANPAYTLDVAGQVRINSTYPQLILSGSDVLLTMYDTFQPYAYSMGVGYNKNYAFEIIDRGTSGTSNSTVFIITGSNVGINTTSPGYQLEVSPGVANATIKLGSWAVMQNVTTNQAMFGYNTLYQTSAGSSWRYLNTGYAMAIRMHDAFGSGDMMFHLAASSSSLAPLTTAWDTTDIKMIIKNSGNVGIGTTTPGAQLEIKKSSQSTPNIYLTGPTNYDGSDYKGLAITNYYSNSGTNRQLSIYNPDYLNYPHFRITVNDLNYVHINAITGSTASIKDLQINNTIYITSGSNVGIGTTGPLSKFHVDGDVFFRSTGTAGYTAYIGSISPGNIGNRYLHARINTISQMMVWIKVFGYSYVSAVIEGIGGGYVDGGTGALTQGFAAGSIVAMHQNGNYTEVVVDTVGTGTTNRWGSITFLGGTDNITTIQPLGITAYSWTATTTRVY